MTQRSCIRSGRRARAAWLVATLAVAGCDDGGVTTTGTGTGGGSTASTTSTATSSTTGASTSTSASTGQGGCSSVPPDPQGSPIADPDDPCATFLSAGEPDERIAFLEKGEDVVLTTETELLWAWRFAARVPAGTEGDYEVEQERCATLAGEAETCETIPLAPLTMECSGPVFGPKMGLDPTQYNVGENVYRVTMRLRRGCEIRSEDGFTMKLTFTP